jgi:N6-adenosine-specific RNA methylase IME4
LGVQLDQRPERRRQASPSPDASAVAARETAGGGVPTVFDFAYKSGVAWAKDHVGTGYWVRNKHELLLIGTRGSVPAPAPGTQWPSLIEAPAGRHSEKPAVFYEIIEGYFPTLPKIELHARGAAARKGWDVSGLEAPTDRVANAA